MDEEVEREEKEKAWADKQEELRKRDEEKLSKNQAKRAKLKARKEKAELARKGGVMDVDGAGEVNGKRGDGIGVKKKLGAAKVVLPTNGGKDEDAVGEGAATNGNGEAENGGGITFVDDD